jgi:HEAT repeat protein
MIAACAAAVLLCTCESAREPRAAQPLPTELTPSPERAARAPSSSPAPAPPPARASATAAAGFDPVSLDVLRQALLSRDDFGARYAAVEALGETRSPAVVEWLAQALGDPEHDVRLAAVSALRHIGGPRAAQLLRSVRDDTTEALDVRAVAAGALLVR